MSDSILTKQVPILNEAIVNFKKVVTESYDSKEIIEAANIFITEARKTAAGLNAELKKKLARIDKSKKLTDAQKKTARTIAKTRHNAAMETLSKKANKIKKAAKKKTSAKGFWNYVKSSKVGKSVAKHPGYAALAAAPVLAGGAYLAKKKADQRAAAVEGEHFDFTSLLKFDE